MKMVTFKKGFNYNKLIQARTSGKTTNLCHII
jgi:hypothetical protein